MRSIFIHGKLVTDRFDYEYYKSRYPDLKAAFGDDEERYVAHYILHGYYECRFCNKEDEEFSDISKYDGVDYSPVYQAAFYKNNYADLRAAFGTDKNKYIQHFVRHGMAEGRQASPAFNLDIYKANYHDLRVAFKNVNVDYYKHYLKYGRFEKRVAYKLINQNIFSDDTATVEILSERVNNVNVYAAHLVFSDYTRFKTCYNSSATTSQMAYAKEAVLCVNGSAALINGSGEMHDGVIPSFSKDKYCPPALYSQKTGKIIQGFGGKYANWKLSTLLEKGICTDTFGFGNALVKNGELCVKESASSTRRPRTFIGTNGKPGDIWLVVAEGDGINGGGPGLTHADCGKYLIGKGCTLGYPLDGGGSSTMVFRQKLVNTPSENGKERGYLGDFIYFK